MTKQPIGEFIASLRKDAGYTQQYVAEKLNISDRTLSSWETDRTEPDLSSLTALADLYGITVDEILRCERKSNSPDFSEAETEHINPVKERFSDFLSALIKLTALGALCAAVVLIGFVLLLYVPAPLWVDFLIVFVGAVGNAAVIAFIFGRTNRALSNVTNEEKGIALTVKHKAALSVIINSLAYIAGVIVLLMCYWFVSYYDTNPVGTVDQNYDLYTASAVIICFVIGGGLLVFALATNHAHINCLGNERQKTAAKTNVKTFKIVSIFGAAFIALCLIPYAVFCHVNFSETERTYFTAKGVDEVYKTFQTYKLGKDKVLTDYDSDGNLQITVIPAGEYYLDFQSEKYVEATELYDIYPHNLHFFDLGNNFYVRHGYWEDCLNNVDYVSMYYLKDGVKLEDISLDKDYSEYFLFVNNYDVVKFTSPEGEPLAAACIPYYFKRDKGYYDDEGWRYDYDCYYNIRDELVLNRNGDEYSYCLVTYRNYSPLATLVLLGSVCVTACVCTAVQLIKRKKISYCF
ncbi:MAG: helix-turn-helix domain-containing protein [Clostridia bacterium]|nr:helix-turn-helix domain-containing protein [Clostridia bacterium]